MSELLLTSRDAGIWRNPAPRSKKSARSSASVLVRARSITEVDAYMGEPYGGLSPNKLDREQACSSDSYSRHNGGNSIQATRKEKTMKTMLNSTYLALALFAVAGFALAPQARAVCQDGCFDNQNTVQGDDALKNTRNTGNTAFGFQALTANTDGNFNTATGSIALESNTTGEANTGIGADALAGNTTGNDNTAIGTNALFESTTASGNTAVGTHVLETSDTGEQNTAIGSSALVRNTTGGFNTVIGVFALKNNTTGNNNIAMGYQAGSLLKKGNNNIYIGSPAAAPSESSSIHIGTVGAHTNTYVAGISGVTVPSGVAVIVDTSGHLGTVVSSERFKAAIRPMDKASEAILSLKPVTFRYKTAFDPKSIRQFGLVAEDVAKVNPDLVAHDEEGKPYTVRYEAVNAMLLNEFLKEHRKVEEQGDRQQKLEATVAQQQQVIQALTATLKAQATQIQKVSDQLRTQAGAPLVVAND